MELLPKWVFPGTYPAVYEFDSATAIEMVAKLHGAMQELIKEYNTFSETLKTENENFKNTIDETCSLFAVDLRQEFQDFIDVVDIKIREQDTKLENTVAEIEERFLKDAQAYINAAINEGKISVATVYEPETQSLYIVGSGGV